MPKFELPPLKESKENTLEAVPENYDPITEDRWYRQVRLPANAEIIDALEVGGMVELKLKGTVTMLESLQEARGKDRQELEIELSSVEAYAENEFSELADDD